MKLKELVLILNETLVNSPERGEQEVFVYATEQGLINGFDSPASIHSIDLRVKNRIDINVF